MPPKNAAKKHPKNTQTKSVTNYRSRGYNTAEAAMDMVGACYTGDIVSKAQAVRFCPVSPYVPTQKYVTNTTHGDTLTLVCYTDPIVDPVAIRVIN